MDSDVLIWIGAAAVLALAAALVDVMRDRAKDRRALEEMKRHCASFETREQR